MNRFTSLKQPIHLERGRKQVALKVLVQSVIRIAPYLPREGPETVIAEILRSNTYGYSYLSTSGGVGNAFTAFLAKISTIVVKPIYLERGRKQFFLIKVAHCCQQRV